MRIEILYLDHKSKNTIALSNFLNYNLIEIDHGTTFNAVFITLINNPKKTQKFKRRFLYKKYADIAIPVYSDYDDELSVENFQKEFEFLESCLHLVHEIEVTPFDFDEDLLRKDLGELKKRIPIYFFLFICILSLYFLDSRTSAIPFESFVFRINAISFCNAVKREFITIISNPSISAIPCKASAIDVYSRLNLPSSLEVENKL